jgi:LemA protein
LTATALIVFLVAATLFGVMALYNLLVRKRQLTNNGWSDIDVQLKRRSDLIPQLVNSVKGYASHERALFDEIAERRGAALAAGDDPAARAKAEGALARPLSRIVALAENYPDLKANENFLALQRELAATEDKIEMARRFYNGAVRELNTLVESVPSNIVAGAFGFARRDYFEIDEADRATPAVSLGARS